MTQQAPDPCAIPGCGHRPRTRICPGHEQKLGQTIADLERLYATLDATPIRGGNDTGRTASGGASPTPGRTEVWALTDSRTSLYAPTIIGPTCAHSTHQRDCPHPTCAVLRRWPADDERAAGATRLVSALGVLHGWADQIRTERGLHRTSTITHRPWSAYGPFHERCTHDSCRRLRIDQAEPITFTGERNVLVRNLDWACEQPWIDTMWTELRALWSLLKAAHGDKPPRPACQCPVIDPGRLTRCGGNVWASDRSARCDRCTTTWTGHDFLRLTLIAEQDAATASSF